MSGLDRKGPQGEGPKTGRGLGKCNPEKTNLDEKENPLGLGLGRRLGRGQGKGRGRGRGFGLRNKQE